MREWIVESADAGMRLDKWLAARTDARARGRATEWLTRGKVFLDGQPAEASAGAHRLLTGQRVGVWIDRPGSSKPSDRSVQAVRNLLRILHEDESIVVDKPAGLLVEPLPGRTGEEATLVNLLADHYRHVPRARSTWSIASTATRADWCLRDTSGTRRAEVAVRRTHPERIYQPSPGAAHTNKPGATWIRRPCASAGRRHRRAGQGR
jgi:23S rRNA-/tRNA-specific pseudouridylate synthase